MATSEIVRVGKLLTAVGMVWAAIGLCLFWTPARAAVNEASSLRVIVFALGLTGTLCIFGSWGLALVHWTKARSANERGWLRWGVPLLVFTFIAAWAYWLSRHDPNATS